MTKDRTLTLGFAPTPLHGHNVKAKRIFATIHASVFVLSQAERRCAELHHLFLEYHNSETERLGLPNQYQVSCDMKPKTGNHMIALAWECVDWLEKARKVISGVSGIKRKEQWYQRLLSAVAPAKEVRAFLQHYDREISTFVSGYYPLMGAIFACVPAKTGVGARLILSNPLVSAYHEKVHICGFMLPSQINSPVDALTFSIGEHSINLTRIISDVQVGKQHLKDYVTRHYNYQWDS